MSFMQYLTPEEASQVTVVNYLLLQYPDVLFHHSPQEIHTISKFQRWKRKVLGTIPGCPDLLIFHEKRFPIKGDKIERNYYCGLAIEMKHGRNRPTRTQNDFMNKLTRAGWKCEVCYDSLEAHEVIDEYLEKK